MRILLVEDDTMIGESVLDCLRAEHYAVDWVKDGHDVESNPWDYLNDDGSEMNYLQCLRIRNGYSQGPWDSWEYSVPWKWDLSGQELIENDTLSK